MCVTCDWDGAQGGRGVSHVTGMELKEVGVWVWLNARLEVWLGVSWSVSDLCLDLCLACVWVWVWLVSWFASGSGSGLFLGLGLACV